MTSNARPDFKIGFDFLKCFKIECSKVELRLRSLFETRPYDHITFGRFCKNFIAFFWSFWRPEKSNRKATTTIKFKGVFDFSNPVDLQWMTNWSFVRISTKNNAIILVAKKHIDAKNAKIANTIWRHAKKHEMRKKNIIAWNFIMINLFQIMF